MSELRKAVDAHYNAYKALSHAYAALSEIIAKEPGLIPQQDPRIDEMREEIRQLRGMIEGSTLDNNGKPRMTPTEAQRAYPTPGGSLTFVKGV